MTSRWRTCEWPTNLSILYGMKKYIIKKSSGNLEIFKTNYEIFNLACRDNYRDCLRQTIRRLVTCAFQLQTNKSKWHRTRSWDHVLIWLFESLAWTIFGQLFWGVFKEFLHCRMLTGSFCIVHVSRCFVCCIRCLNSTSISTRLYDVTKSICDANSCGRRTVTHTMHIHVLESLRHQFCMTWVLQNMSVLIMLRKA